MDQEKVERALKEIFSKYGLGIMCDSNKFRSALFDLLDAQSCRDERIAFRNVLESDELRPFVQAAPVTEDMVAQVLEQMIKSHVTEKDARFVVQCILAARGDGAIAASLGKGQEENNQREAGGQQGMTAQGAAWSKERQDVGGRNVTRQGSFGQNVTPPASSGQNVVAQQNADGCIVEAECKMACLPAMHFPQGKLRVYQDKLLFTPYQYRKNKQIEICYRNISKVVSQYKTGKIVLIIIVLAEVLMGWTIGLIYLIVFAIILVLMLIYAFRYWNRQVEIFASGKRYLLKFDKTLDKKQILSIIQQRLNTHWIK